MFYAANLICHPSSEENLATRPGRIAGSCDVMFRAWPCSYGLAGASGGLTGFDGLLGGFTGLLGGLTLTLGGGACCAGGFT